MKVEDGHELMCFFFSANFQVIKKEAPNEGRSLFFPNVFIPRYIEKFLNLRVKKSKKKLQG